MTQVELQHIDLLDLREIWKINYEQVRINFE